MHWISTEYSPPTSTNHIRNHRMIVPLKARICKTPLHPEHHRPSRTSHLSWSYPSLQTPLSPSAHPHLCSPGIECWGLSMIRIWRSGNTGSPHPLPRSTCRTMLTRGLNAANWSVTTSTVDLQSNVDTWTKCCKLVRNHIHGRISFSL